MDAPNSDAAEEPKETSMEAFAKASRNARMDIADFCKQRKMRSKSVNMKAEDLQTQDQTPEALAAIEAAKREVIKQEKDYYRSRYPVRDIKITDFELMQTIGNGAFGIVRLCRVKPERKNALKYIPDGEVCALKQMKKRDMQSKNQRDHAIEEKKALAKAEMDCPWVTSLHACFQDQDFLYMVMEFMQGGDMMTHLIQRDRFTEAETKFYVAELTEALDYIHTRLNYIHRDIKPDNILLDAKGHIKLLDFGLCKYDEAEEQRRKEAQATAAGDLVELERLQSKRGHVRQMSTVGTPDYMAPEVYTKDYSKAVDFWSVGIIMYECLFGGPPFADENHDQHRTYARVQQWERHFTVPDEVLAPGSTPERPLGTRVSAEAVDCLHGFINHADQRFTAQQIRVHPWFRGLDFAALHETEPPIRPTVAGPADVRNFDNFDQVLDAETDRTVAGARGRLGSMLGDDGHLFYSDYAYKRQQAPETAELFDQQREAYLRANAKQREVRSPPASPDQEPLSPSKSIAWEKRDVTSPKRVLAAPQSPPAALAADGLDAEPAQETPTWGDRPSPTRAVSVPSPIDGPKLPLPSASSLYSHTISPTQGFRGVRRPVPLGAEQSPRHAPVPRTPHGLAVPLHPHNFYGYPQTPSGAASGRASGDRQRMMQPGHHHQVVQSGSMPHGRPLPPTPSSRGTVPHGVPSLRQGRKKTPTHQHAHSQPHFPPAAQVSGFGVQQPGYHPGYPQPVGFGVQQGYPVPLVPQQYPPGPRPVQLGQRVGVKPQGRSHFASTSQLLVGSGRKPGR